MTRKSPLDDPVNAAHAWARYRQIMKVLLAATILTVAIAMGLLFAYNGMISVHFYIAVALGISLTMLLGGGLTGAQLYGQMPVLARRNLSNNSFDASTHQIASGVLIPTTSVDQLAYSVGRWMGVSHSHLAGVLPNLSNFNSPQVF